MQPGSLDSEAGIFMCTFDMSGCRLLTAEADKTVKIYKEDEAAVGLSSILRQQPSEFVFLGLSPIP